MSPAADVSTSAPSTSAFSMMMSDLSGALDTPETKVSDPAVDAEIAEVPDDDAPEQTLDGAAEETQEQQAVDPHADEDDPTKPEMENLSLAKWNRVHGAYKYAKELGKAFGVVGDDGKLDLTLLPKVEEVQAMQTAHSDRLAMEHDFASADPQNAKQFIENWDKFSPQGMAAIAAALPEYLATANTAAYVQVARPVMARFFQGALRNVAQMPPELQDRMIDAVRMADWYAKGGMNGGGKGMTDEEIGKLIAPQSAAPVNADQQELQRTRAELQQFRQQQATEKWTAFNNDFNDRAGAELSTEVDKALEPLKKFYPNEMALGNMRKEFYARMDKAMSGDPLKRQFDMLYENIKAGRATADADALKAQYMTMARRAINAVRVKFTNEASKGIVDTSTARNTQLEKTASKVGVTTPGAPRPQSIAGPMQRKAGESASAFQFRQMQSDVA